jgi:hypothetical protein
MQLQKQLKVVVQQVFEFRNTKNGTRVITKDLVDFEAVKLHFQSIHLSFYSFFPKSEKPIKAVIRHLPNNTPAEDITEGLGDIGFDVVSVKQMSTSRRSPEGTPATLPLFLVTLAKTIKSQEIFKLSSLCHIAIKVEAYKSQNPLTHCYNCQTFGNVWANCRQPTRCLWCGGCHLHGDCPEKGNPTSTPACCNCQLAEGETEHPANYRRCRHAKEEMRKKKKPQGTLKNTTGRVFSSTFTKPTVSFAAALRGQAEQKGQQEEAASGSETPKLGQKQRGQSVPAPIVNSEPQYKAFRALAVVEQIMRELKGAVSEEEMVLAITKIVITLMKEDGK